MSNLILLEKKLIDFMLKWWEETLLRYPKDIRNGIVSRTLRQKFQDVVDETVRKFKAHSAVQLTVASRNTTSVSVLTDLDGIFFPYTFFCAESRTNMQFLRTHALPLKQAGTLAQFLHTFKRLLDEAPTRLTKSDHRILYSLHRVLPSKPFMSLYDLQLPDLRSTFLQERFRRLFHSNIVQLYSIFIPSKIGLVSMFCHHSTPASAKYRPYTVWQQTFSDQGFSDSDETFWIQHIPRNSVWWSEPHLDQECFLISSVKRHLNLSRRGKNTFDDSPNDFFQYDSHSVFKLSYEGERVRFQVSDLKFLSLLRYAMFSPTDLAQFTGLSRQTVHNRLTYLFDEKILYQVPNYRGLGCTLRYTLFALGKAIPLTQNVVSHLPRARSFIGRHIRRNQPAELHLISLPSTWQDSFEATLESLSNQFSEDGAFRYQLRRLTPLTTPLPLEQLWDDEKNRWTTEEESYQAFNPTTVRDSNDPA